MRIGSQDVNYMTLCKQSIQHTLFKLNIQSLQKKSSFSIMLAKKTAIRYIESQFSSYPKEIIIS